MWCEYRGARVKNVGMRSIEQPSRWDDGRFRSASGLARGVSFIQRNRTPCDSLLTHTPIAPTSRSRTSCRRCFNGQVRIIVLHPILAAHGGEDLLSLPIIRPIGSRPLLSENSSHAHAAR